MSEPQKAKSRDSDRRSFRSSLDLGIIKKTINALDALVTNSGISSENSQENTSTLESLILSQESNVDLKSQEPLSQKNVNQEAVTSCQITTGEKHQSPLEDNLNTSKNSVEEENNNTHAELKISSLGHHISHADVGVSNSTSCSIPELAKSPIITAVTALSKAHASAQNRNSIETNVKTHEVPIVQASSSRTHRSESDFTQPPYYPKNNVKPVKGLLKMRLNNESSETAQESKRIKFDKVNVYHFPREQGYVGVPTEGGYTLGMSTVHEVVESHNFNEYTNNRIIKFRNEIQHVPAKERQALLKKSGVQKLDQKESRQLNRLRTMREHCGCACRKICLPDSCPCALAGIQCQDHRYACKCVYSECRNPAGIDSPMDHDDLKQYYGDTFKRIKREEGCLEDTAEEMPSPPPTFNAS